MALANNDLYPAEVTRGTQLRVQPDEGPGALVPKTFASNAGAVILPAGCPVYADSSTGFWAKIVPAGTTTYAAATAVEQVQGIVWPTAIQTVNGSEVIGTVMLRGSAHIDDVATAFGGSTANFLTACRNPSTRFRGIFLEGLTLAL